MRFIAVRINTYFKDTNELINYTLFMYKLFKITTNVLYKIFTAKLTYLNFIYFCKSADLMHRTVFQCQNIISMNSKMFVVKHPQEASYYVTLSKIVFFTFINQNK